MLNPVRLSQELIACPSITPSDAGCMVIIEQILVDLGFQVSRLRFGDVDNLYARINSKEDNLCFAGHTDVVPIGNLSDWSVDPFAGVVKDDRLFGRGAADMKCAIACYISAVANVLADNSFDKSLSILLTSDEEGPAENGTRKMVPWVQEKGEMINSCIVGEPTNPNRVGQMAKVGRRGSLSGHITVTGKMGHVAYPNEAANPVHPITDFLASLHQQNWDKGTDVFLPSSLQITSVDVGNRTNNVIPRTATAAFNIRYNILQTAKSLQSKIEKLAKDCINLPFELRFHHSGEPFLGADARLQNVLGEAVNQVCGSIPEFTTTGGTSDARFIRKLCPVIEFGMNSDAAHQVDESVSIDDILKLTAIYDKFIRIYFAD